MDRTENPLAEIVGRLDRLERQNRRLKSLLGLGLAVAFAAASVGAGSGSDAGRPHRESLVLHDGNGFTRLLLEANEKAASLKVMDPDGKTRILLGTDKAGKPMFTIHDTDGRLVRKLID